VKINVKVMSVRSIWWEEFDTDTDSPEQWAKDTIKHFNRTRRPGELRRTVLAVDVLDLVSIRDHKYEKTNLVTKSDSGGVYDTVKCGRCGITGKRYGLGSYITRDRKYKAEKYLRCDTAMKALGVGYGI
jgi:hypothetical protein